MEKLERTMLKQKKKTNKHEEEIRIIFDALKQLLKQPQKQIAPIGFKIGVNKK